MRPVTPSFRSSIAAIELANDAASSCYCAVFGRLSLTLGRHEITVDECVEKWRLVDNSSSFRRSADGGIFGVSGTISTRSRWKGAPRHPDEASPCASA